MSDLWLVDRLWDYRHVNGSLGHCRVIITKPDEAYGIHTVLVMELMTNDDGPSVTNCIEQIITGLLRTYEFLDTEHDQWLEVYERDLQPTDFTGFLFRHKEPFSRIRFGQINAAKREVAYPRWEVVPAGSVAICLGKELRHPSLLKVS